MWSFGIGGGGPKILGGAREPKWCHDFMKADADDKKNWWSISQNFSVQTIFFLDIPELGLKEAIFNISLPFRV